MIVQDQDSADCKKLKESLLELARPSGREVLVRIACKELEAWYWGDLNAISKAYGKSITELQRKRKYREPDKIENPKDELRKLIPKHQQLDGARKISAHMDIQNNTSESFQVFVQGVKAFALS